MGNEQDSEDTTQHATIIAGVNRHICVFITAPRSVHDCIDACPPAEVVVRLTPVAGGLDDAKRNEQWACSAAFQLGKHGVSTPRPIPSQNGRLVESVACAGDSGTCRGGVPGRSEDPQDEARREQARARTPASIGRESRWRVEGHMAPILTTRGALGGAGPSATMLG